MVRPRPASGLAAALVLLGTAAAPQEGYRLTPTEVVVVGEPSDERTRALLEPLRRQLPTFAFAGLAPGEASPFPTPLLEGRADAGTPTAYVCHGYVCDLPAHDPATLALQLAGSR